MPIYEYKCENCGHQLEILQKISDAPATTCPACGQDSLRKMISAAAFKLKGTGWYETDFKDKKSGKQEAAATDAKAKPGTDSKKPASDTAAKAKSSDSTSDSK